MAMDVVDYEIKGAEMQFVEVELDPGEAAIGEAGSLFFMDGSIDMDAVFGDGSSGGGGGFFGKLLGAGKRLITGESLFTTVYSNKGSSKARVAFGAPYPGKIIAMDLKQMGGMVICQRDSFLCAARGVSIGIHFQQKLGVGFFGGEGFIMQKLEGDGLAFVHSGGTVLKRTLLPGQTLLVDTGCLVAHTPNVNFEIQYVGKIKTALFGGEGLFLAKLTGPGDVWLQSLPFSRLASRIFAAAPQVGNAASHSLTFLDPATGVLQRTLRDIQDPYHLRFSPDMKWLVVASNRLDKVDLYHWQPAQADRPLRLARRLDAPKTPSHIAIDSRSSVSYVSLQDSHQLLAVDLGTLAPRWTQAVGKLPADIFLTPDDRTLLVALTGDRVVEAWDVSTTPPRLVKRIMTGDGAHAFRSRGDKRHVFVSNRVANTISLIDHLRLEVVAEYPGPGGPDCMELLADGRTLLVSSRWARKLSFVDLESRKVVHQVDVGRSPHGVWTLDHAPR
jgi:uncharacterized protein (TIGR00266 family)